jgi:phenylalanyl-tRNA synthetase beta chain
MKVSYQWLKEFVCFDASPRQLADALTNSGTVVETLQTSGDDTILDLDLTSNRPDCLSHQGIAREVSVIYQKPLQKILPVVEGKSEPASSRVSVEIEAPHLCSRYCARVIRGLKVGPSPQWLVRRLEGLGQRSINNVADLTNYVLLEMGHPLHAFDLAKIGGGKIIVREARSGEKMFTLDGEERVLPKSMLVIADAEKPVALAGIMGGLESEISFSTTDVLLESAWFDPISIRKSSKQLGLHTEASHRFERGADIEATIPAIDRVAQLILKEAGGELLRGIVDCHPRPLHREPVLLRKSRVESVMGVTFAETLIERILSALEFPILEKRADGWIVGLPSFRLDVEREIDLVEEIARHYGYDQFPSALPKWSGWGKRRPESARQSAIQARLRGLGYHETLSYSFVDASENLRFSQLNTVRISNPLSSEMEVMRTSLVPGLFQSLLRNYNRGIKNARLYELGRIYWWKAERVSEEEPHLGLIATGREVEKQLHQAGRDFSFYDLKGDVASLLAALQLPAVELEFRRPRPLSIASLKTEIFHPWVSAEIWRRKQCLGILGQLHPTLVDSYKVKQDVFVALLSLGTIFETESKEIQFREIPRFPAVQRDLALVIPHEVEYKQIEQSLSAEEIPELREFAPFDLYVGEKLPAGKKGLAISLFYQAPDRTLQEEEVNRLQERVLTILHSHFGAELRR